MTATRKWLILTVAVAAAAACNPQEGPEPVYSAGGRLVERTYLDAVLIARRPTEVFEQPRRIPVLFMFWTEPASAGFLPPGAHVRVINVRETYLWRDRFVWLELRQPHSTKNMWYRIGPQVWATANLRARWDRETATNGLPD
ncbi:MAG: hypothetical protein OXF40_05405 [Rhodospirillales bacterium]|nr:hypothetical protein [Rhodospirillales bacterium]